MTAKRHGVQANEVISRNFTKMSSREKILQKLNPNLLKITPKLSGNAGAFIDLGFNDSLEDGAKKLMLRFFRNQDLCEKNKTNLRQNGVEIIVSSAKYNDKSEISDIETERLMLPFKKNEEDDVCDKPGRRLQKLKMELQEKMSAKWEEEYKKRVSENKIYDKLVKKHFHEEEEGCKNISEGEDYDKGDEADVESINDNDDEADAESVNDNDVEVDEESINDNNNVEKKELNDLEKNNFEKDDEYENCSLIPAYQPGGGMLYGGSELTQSYEGLPQSLISPSLRLSVNESSASKLLLEFQNNDSTPKKAVQSSARDTSELFTVKTKLFSQIPDDSYDLDDAFEFCSGKFPDELSQSELAAQNANVENRDQEVVDDDDEEEEEEEDDDDDDKEEEELDESEEEVLESKEESSRSRKNIITFEDSEEEEGTEISNDNLDEPQTEFKSLVSDEENNGTDLQKKKKTRKSLLFSDDEDDAEADEEEKKEEEVEEDDFDQRSIQYDSEENEIINPKEFFEKEAELSGSEWSGDEDEIGLDQFDVEDGDADEIDNDQVRSQLEKIHIRRVLDDDAREVRLIQEILFEDGDLHSDGKRRDRKFKWKNLGTFDEQGYESGVKEDDGNTSEEDGAQENELRKIRLEKELFLMGKNKDEVLNFDDEIENFEAVKVKTVKTSVHLSSHENTKAAPSLTNIASLSNNRGSFLTRNEEFLSKLAKVTSGLTDNILGPKNSKNFVFATKSPKKASSDKSTACKRQMESTENYTRREKKLKLQPPEIDVGPSILDLLV